MNNDGHTIGNSNIKDRKTGLILFGVFEILLGAFSLLMAPLMIFGAVASAAVNKGSGPSVSASTMIPGVVFYVLLAVGSIWMGIGSIQARRWARALLLVTSWFWLISGIMGLAFMLLFLPHMYDQMGKSGQIPQQIGAIIKYVTIGSMVVFYIIIPGVFVLFYGSKHTKATCERRDTHVRWTDKCPLPVLAVSLMAGLGAVSMPMMGAYGWAFPFFGVILTGVSGAGAILAAMVLLGYVARGFYTLNIRAWWCAVIMIVIWGVSCAITFSRVSMMEFYEKMNLPSQQLEMLKQFPLSWESWMVPMCGLWAVVALAYLFYTRKYLLRQESGAPATGTAQIVEPVPPPALPPLPPSPPVAAPSGGLAIASCVLGVLAVVLGIVVIGGVLGIIGLILGVVHLARRRSHRLLAGCGIGLSAAGMALAIAVVIFGWMLARSFLAGHATMGNSFQASAWIGKPAPEMTLTALDGRTIRTAEWKGHPVVVDMWASWHPACVAAVPDFTRLVADTSAQGVRVLAVSFEEPADLGGFATNRAINYPIVATTNLPAPFADVASIPTTFFINAEGIIRDIRVGYEGYDALKRSALDRSPPSGAKEQEEAPHE